MDAQFVFIFASAILLDHQLVCCAHVSVKVHSCGQQHVFVCVFYKLALEPSGLIMWPSNYTGLSEKARGA